jgi:hypothetical protein
MLALVMLAGWADYLVGFYGWCLLKNYDVTIGQLASPLHPYAGKWPPGPIGPGSVFPTGKATSSAGDVTRSPGSSAAAQRKTAQRSVTGTVSGSRF